VGAQTTAIAIAHATTAAEAAAGSAGPAPSQPHESLPLARAHGRILAADLRAAQPVPHVATAAMDGYAVAGDPPWDLEDAPIDTPLEPGRARTIVTGGRVPAGASGVVRQEYTEASATGRPAADRPTPAPPARIRLRADAPTAELAPGRHIRPAGREAQAGDLLARAGDVLTPARVALAAICGFNEVPVHRARSVALLLTGDEVITSGMPAAGQVRDAFEVQLPHVLTRRGVEVAAVERIGDDRATTRAALARLAAQADAVVTTGGTARSAADHVRAALESTDGVRVVIPQLGMRPGHPTMLAVDERAGTPVPILALPGNPLAAMAAMRVVGSALLRGLTGRPAEAPLTVPVAVDLDGEKVDRLVPATPEDGAPEGEEVGPVAAAREPRWRPRPHVAAHMMRGLADAQGWLVLPPHPVAAGERIPFLPLEE
jgi:molybdopterin molybdotransferase